MADINIVAISGRLTRDVSMRSEKVAALAVAVNRNVRNSIDETWEQHTTFVDCLALGSLAGRAGKLKKGCSITVQGRLELSQWEAEDGSKRSQLRVVIEQFDSPDLRKPKADAAQETLPLSGFEADTHSVKAQLDEATA